MALNGPEVGEKRIHELLRTSVGDWSLGVTAIVQIYVMHVQMGMRSVIEPKKGPTFERPKHGPIGWPSGI